MAENNVNNNEKQEKQGMTVKRVESIRIRRLSNKYKDLYKYLDRLTYLAKNIYNSVSYEMRKILEENGGDVTKLPSFFDKNSEFTKLNGMNEILDSNANEYIVKATMDTWKAYQKTVQEFDKDAEKYCSKRGIDKKLLKEKKEDGTPVCRPTVPRYLDSVNGRYVYMTRRSFKADENGNYICTSKAMNKIYQEVTGKEVFMIPSYRKKMDKQNALENNTEEMEELKQFRVIPTGEGFKIEFVFDVYVEKELEKESKYRTKEDREKESLSDVPERLAVVRIGINDFACVVNNFGEKPFILSGDAFKPIINEYVTERARLMSLLEQDSKGARSTKRIGRLSCNFVKKSHYRANMYSRFIVNWCIEHNVDEVILPDTKGIKNGSKGEYVGLMPVQIFREQLMYKLEEAGIQVRDVKVAYTKYTSFLDLEGMTAAKAEKGKDRVKDGMFMADDGTVMRSCINTAYQLMRKRYKNVFDSESVRKVILEPDIYTIENNRGTGQKLVQTA